MKRLISGALLATIIASAGCQPSNPPADKPAEPAAGSTSANVRQSDPGKLAQDFLTALFAGDTQRATSMMTVKAQQASKDAGIEIEAPGSKTATFKITDAKVLEDTPNAAHVWSVISDTNEQGQTEPYDIVWLLTREPQGWAISGMATVLFNHEFVIDFEDSKDVLAKRQWAQKQAQLEQAARTSGQVAR